MAGRMLGRLSYKSHEDKRHRGLTNLLEDMVERARDSTILDVAVDVGKVEELFALDQVSVMLPPNEWREDGPGQHQDRWFCLSLYIDRVVATLEKQGLITSKSDSGQ